MIILIIIIKRVPSRISAGGFIVHPWSTSPRSLVVCSLVALELKSKRWALSCFLTTNYNNYLANVWRTAGKHASSPPTTLLSLWCVRVQSGRTFIELLLDYLYNLFFKLIFFLLGSDLNTSIIVLIHLSVFFGSFLGVCYVFFFFFWLKTEYRVLSL